MELYERQHFKQFQTNRFSKYLYSNGEYVFISRLLTAISPMHDKCVNVLHAYVSESEYMFLLNLLLA